MINRAKQSTHWRRMLLPLPHAAPALLYSVQLILFGNQIGDAGAAGLAKSLVPNDTLTRVCLAGHGACVMGTGEGCTLTSDAVTIAPRCACSALLGAALSQRQSNWRCRCRGACEGSCGQPHVDSCLHGVARSIVMGRGDGNMLVSDAMLIAMLCLLRSARRSSLSATTRSAMPALRSLRRHWRPTAC